MARKTVLYFEDEDGVGRVARDRSQTWLGSGKGMRTDHDYLVVERYDGRRWVEEQRLGDYVDPDDLDVPKP